MRGGCQFIKTSTGKTPNNATLENSEWMLEAIEEDDQKASMGFKAAGGVRDFDTARKFLTMTHDKMGPSYLCPKMFRFGASSLLKNLRSVVSGEVETNGKNDENY